MDAFLLNLLAFLVFPAGLTIFLTGLAYEWLNRKLLARFQNRVGPRWFQPLADVLKLLAKEEIVPEAVNPYLFVALPLIALAGCLTAALYVPIWGIGPLHNFPGDLIVTLFLLSLLTMCLGLAGANTLDRFSLVGATRAFTQLFSYEAPFLLALLGPAFVAGTWQIDEIMAFGKAPWLILTQPIGFLVALIGLIGKLELPPFDAPEAETEIVAGSLTEYSGRGLALFRLGKGMELEEAQKQIGMVAEGVFTAQALETLQAGKGVEMPICREVQDVLFRGKSPRVAVQELMERAAKPESNRREAASAPREASTPHGPSGS